MPWPSAPPPLLAEGDDGRPEGGRAEAGGGEGGFGPDWAELLFSATTLSDFSNTFQSLMVLSVGGSKACEILCEEERGGRGAHRWSRGGSGRHSGACTTGSC